jgi:hypothetical protein
VHVAFYSYQKKSRTFGTGFIVRKKRQHLVLALQQNLTEYGGYEIKGKFFKYSHICAHSPTEDKTYEEKDFF